MGGEWGREVRTESRSTLLMTVVRLSTRTEWKEARERTRRMPVCREIPSTWGPGVAGLQEAHL